MAEHQPSYFPWLGLLDKINKSDIFILLDTVQFNDNSFQSRNLFLNHTGESQYLSIPISKKNYQNKTIKDMKIVDKRWQKKHRGYIIANYSKHPFYKEVYSVIDQIYTKKYEYLIDVLIDSMLISKKILGIDAEIVLASDLDYDRLLVKDELVLSLLEATNASKYISGEGAKDYQDDNKFIERKIDLEYQSFIHPVYSQKNSKEFIAGLSILDVLFNLGLDESKKLLKGI